MLCCSSRPIAPFEGWPPCLGLRPSVLHKAGSCCGSVHSSLESLEQAAIPKSSASRGGVLYLPVTDGLVELPSDTLRLDLEWSRSEVTILRWPQDGPSWSLRSLARFCSAHRCPDRARLTPLLLGTLLSMGAEDAFFHTPTDEQEDEIVAAVLLPPNIFENSSSTSALASLIRDLGSQSSLIRRAYAVFPRASPPELPPYSERLPPDVLQAVNGFRGDFVFVEDPSLVTTPAEDALPLLARGVITGAVYGNRCSRPGKAETLAQRFSLWMSAATAVSRMLLFLQL